jgi:FimV-like protein
LDDLEHDSHHEQAGMGGQLKDHIKLDFDLDLPHLHEPELGAEEPSHVPFLPTTPIPTSGNPYISEHPSARRKEEENPLEIRFDLAQELWQVGQHHTARAIVQEIAQQATGELLHQAQAWLAQKG